MSGSEGVTGSSGTAWSDRFEEGLHPVIERFNASIEFDIALLQQDLDGSVESDLGTYPVPGSAISIDSKLN